MWNILIVDDSAFARSFVKRAVEQCDAGYPNYLEASSVDDAMTLVEKNNIELIITDLNMDGKSGEDLIVDIKGNIITKHIPIIVVTSLKNPSRVNRLIQLDALAVLDKPINTLELKKIIKSQMKYKKVV